MRKCPEGKEGEKSTKGVSGFHGAKRTREPTKCRGQFAKSRGSAQPPGLVPSTQSRCGIRCDDPLPRMLRVLLLLLTLALLVSEAQCAANLPPGTRFIMSHFGADGGGGDERLYISISPDGVNWTALNNGQPVWQPAGWAPFGNVVRDPSIIFANGFYWVVFTSGNYGHHASFGLVKSADLVNWTFVQEVLMSVPFTNDPLTWSPIFYHDLETGVHVFVAFSRINGSQYNLIPDMTIYELHPMNFDFTSWSVPEKLKLPFANTNEFYVWREGPTYHAIYVVFPGGYWVHSTASSLTGVWTGTQNLGRNSMEGGMMLRRPEGGYRFYVEPGNGGTPPGFVFFDLDETMTPLTHAQPLKATVPMRNGKMIAAPNTTTYSQWQQLFLADLPADQQRPESDPDQDGQINLHEFANGAHPKLSSQYGLPTPVFSSRRQEGKLRAVRYRRLMSAANVSRAFEASHDLKTWEDQQFSSSSRTLFTDGTETWDSFDGYSGDPSLTRFARLRVTLLNPLAPLLEPAAVRRPPPSRPRLRASRR
ncbi:MAG: arabinofuranosidase [Chthoniobacter sp.]|nr:arabinofuranosidase [Chthoniobacter sp.]